MLALHLLITLCSGDVHFLYRHRSEGVMLMPDMTQFLDFVSVLIFSFGAAFEIPVATVLLVATGLIKISTLENNRRYVIVIIAIIAAALTPPGCRVR